MGNYSCIDIRCVDECARGIQYRSDKTDVDVACFRVGGILRVCRCNRVVGNLRTESGGDIFAGTGRSQIYAVRWCNRRIYYMDRHHSDGRLGTGEGGTADRYFAAADRVPDRAVRAVWRGESGFSVDKTRWYPCVCSGIYHFSVGEVTFFRENAYCISKISSVQWVYVLIMQYGVLHFVIRKEYLYCIF